MPRKIRPLEELAEGSAVAVVGTGDGVGLLAVYTDDAAEELKGLVAVLVTAAAKLAKDGVPAQFIIEMAKAGAKARGDLLELDLPSGSGGAHPERGEKRVRWRS